MTRNNKIKYVCAGFGSVIIILGLFFSTYFFKNASNDNKGNLPYQELIDSIPNYMLQVIQFNDSNASEGAELLVYFERTSGETKIIRTSYGGETYMKDYSFYFSDDASFWLIEEFKQWDRPYSVEGRVLISDTENIYQVSDLQLISWKNELGVNINPSATSFTQKENEILLLLEEYLAMIADK